MVRRNTKQKRLIMETLEKMKHPSATAVYEAARKSDPTISRATVFRVLSRMAEEGRIRRFKLSGADDRFDLVPDKHFHILCRACGRADDIEVAETVTGALSAADARGYTVEGYDIEFVGLCPECTEKNKPRN